MASQRSQSPEPEPDSAQKAPEPAPRAHSRSLIATAGIKKPPTIVQPALRSGGTSGRKALALHSDSRGPHSRHVSRAKTKPSQAKPKPKSGAKPKSKGQAKQPNQPARTVWRGAVWETCQPSQHQAKPSQAKPKAKSQAKQPNQPARAVRRGAVGRYICQAKTKPSQQPTIFESKPHSGGA